MRNVKKSICISQKVVWFIMNAQRALLFLVRIFLCLFAEKAGEACRKKCKDGALPVSRISNSLKVRERG
jgi:hypothetical protein